MSARGRGRGRPSAFSQLKFVGGAPDMPKFAPPPSISNNNNMTKSFGNANDDFGEPRTPISAVQPKTLIPQQQTKPNVNKDRTVSFDNGHQIREYDTDSTDVSRFNENIRSDQSTFNYSTTEVDTSAQTSFAPSQVPQKPTGFGSRAVYLAPKTPTTPEANETFGFDAEEEFNGSNTTSNPRSFNHIPINSNEQSNYNTTFSKPGSTQSQEVLKEQEKATEFSNEDILNAFQNDTRPVLRTGANYVDQQREAAPGSFGRKSSQGQPFGQEQRPEISRPNGFGNKAVEENKGFGDKKGFGEKKDSRNGFGERNDFGDKKGFEDRQGFGENKRFGENRGFGDQPNVDSNRSPRFSALPSTPDVDFGGEGDQRRGQRGERRPRRNDEESGLSNRKPSNDEDEREKHTPFIPEERNLDDIFAEDQKASREYSSIYSEDQPIIVEGVDAPAIIEEWEQAQLLPKLHDNIIKANYNCPRKIQAYTIPPIMEGSDLKAQAETGSGKSAAFLIPIIDRIAKMGKREDTVGCPLALIIEPTRELATQLYDQGRKLAMGTGVTVARAYGQYRIVDNAKELLRGCDIVVATPGRITHFLEDNTISASKLIFFVLDEADRLLDDSFSEDLNRIQSVKNYPSKESGQVQTLLFSATFGPEVEHLSTQILRPDRIFVHCKSLNAPNQRVSQFFLKVDKCEKNEKCVEMIGQFTDNYKQEGHTEPPRILIFVQTKRQSDVIAVYLVQHGYAALSLNGDRPQYMREQALMEFRKRKCPILVATDVCARGIDIKELDYVLNLDLPRDMVTYVHRIGRTGRLTKGNAMSFFDPADSNDRELAPYLRSLLTDAGIDVPSYIDESIVCDGISMLTTDIDAKPTEEDMGF